MNLNTESKLGVQSAALIGVTVVSALHAAKNIAKVFVGNDKFSNRTDNWLQASKEEGYLSSIGKRIQFFVGSDSFSQRVTNLFKGLVMAGASIIISDLARTNSNCSKTSADLREELADINFEASNAKEVAGEYIEACLNKNQAEKVSDLIACITTAFSSMNQTLTTTTADLNNCQQSNAALNFDFATNRESFERLQETHSKALKDLEASSKASSLKDDTIKSLKQQIGALNLKVIQEQQASSNYTITLDNLTDRLRPLQEDVNRLGTENTDLKKQVSNLKTEIAEIKAKRDQANAAKKTAESSLAQKTKELADKQNEVDTATDSLSLEKREHQACRTALQDELQKPKGKKPGQN